MQAQPSQTSSGRPHRRRRLPARYRDNLPEAAPTEIVNPAPLPVLQQVTLLVRNRFSTLSNVFGMWRQYLYRPSYDPDHLISPEDLYNTHAMNNIPETSLEEDTGTEPAEQMLECNNLDGSGYSNRSVELLMNWQNSGSSNKSNLEVSRLVNDVLRDPQFLVRDLEKFDAKRENQRADKFEKTSPHLRFFTETSVPIDVPSGSKDVPPRTFYVPGLHYRKLVSVIRAAFDSPLADKFHYNPFKLYRRGSADDTGQSERIYSELYDSDVFIQEHDKVQRAPTDDESCKREKAVAALMFWSDATHLADFGTAKLWPIYLLLGNLSKYIRAEPNSGATNHLAYIPSLDDALQDQLKSHHQKWDTQQKEVLTHLRRELIHAVWKLLLDDDFLHAYKYGIVILCRDGIERRIYPRIFTYSADYPEKYVSMFLSALLPSFLTLCVTEYCWQQSVIKAIVLVLDAP